MEQSRLKLLTGKYHKGTLTQDERKELNDWFHALNLAGDDFENWINEAGSEENLADELFLGFKQKLEKPKQTYKWLAAAATVLLFIGISTFVIRSPKPTQKSITYKKNIPPGTNNAILTLSNGQQIVLSAVTNGQLARQGNAVINRVSNNAITYNANDEDEGKPQYNTLTTPAGGQHTLTLSDGTKVWLNAASSIKFPVAFAGTERRVEITGEAYFEVIHNTQKPFRVIARGQTIEDLGTHFDVNSYTDEPVVKTTLIEGKVQVTKNASSAILEPGQQALSFNDEKIKVVKADTTLVLAWKNGLFKFRNASLAEVTRQLARWYNVKIVLEGNISDRQFSGEITRDVNMSEVLDILSYLKINFQTEQEGEQIVIKVNAQ
jgi:transmembrane sensor